MPINRRTSRRMQRILENMWSQAPNVTTTRAVCEVLLDRAGDALSIRGIQINLRNALGVPRSCVSGGYCLPCVCQKQLFRWQLWAEVDRLHFGLCRSASLQPALSSIGGGSLTITALEQTMTGLKIRDAYRLCLRGQAPGAVVFANASAIQAACSLPIHCFSSEMRVSDRSRVVLACLCA